MLIVCPSCASRYELDATKLGPAGRKVRCAACQTQWHVTAEPEPVPVPSAEDVQALLAAEIEEAAAIAAQVTAVASEQSEIATQVDAVLAEPKRRPGRKARSAKPVVRIGGLSSLGLPIAASLAGLVIVSALIWQRDLAVRGAPQLAGLFQTLGMPVNVRGLALSSVESGLVEDGQGRFLVVEGDVTNVTKGIAKVPLIEVAVKDAAGQTLYTWTTDPPRQSLEPSELVRFRARLASPPATGQSVKVRFTSAVPTSVASIR